jgi:sulfhydrogenase subunit beta (sulfur reductase)
MLFKVMTKEDFRRLVEKLLAAMEVIGAKKVATALDGKPIHHYLPVESFGEIDLEYETTEYSAKTYFLPFKENLSTYDFETGDWRQEIRYRLQPRAIIGLHACDINALNNQDKVLAKGFFPSPYYIARRRNTFVVGLDHMPCEGGFCHSLGTDTVTHGFDLYLTDLGDRYFTAIGSERGYTAVQQVAARDVEERDTRDYLEARRRISAAFKDQISLHNLPNLLDLEFESEVWKKWGGKCLSCGSCAMVCPTCYCYGVTERVSMDFKKGAKVKQLYSCNLVDFAAVAGGHNFRPDRQTRLKYRYYHQHRGFVEAHGDPLCVGCDRCGRACLAGIDPAEVIRDLQAEESHE